MLKENRAVATLLVAVALLLALFGAFTISSAGASGHQITICHATGNEGHYSMPSPAKHQIYDNNGHRNGNENAVHTGDIIPPFGPGSQGSHEWGAYPGFNWDAEGQAIWNNGCETPEPSTTKPPTTEPPVTEPPTTEPPTTEPPTTEPPTTEPPTTEPPTTEPPTTEPPTTEPPTTEPPTTEPPTTEPPTTEPPTTDPPTTEPPVEQETPTTEAPTEEERLPLAAASPAEPEPMTELAYTGIADETTFWLALVGLALISSGGLLVWKTRKATI